jgi:hypothetical protein
MTGHSVGLLVRSGLPFGVNLAPNVRVDVMVLVKDAAKPIMSSNVEMVRA